MLTAKKIDRYGKSKKRVDEPVSEGSGLYLRRQGSSKRFVGRKRYGGKTVDISLGKWGEEFLDPIDALNLWKEILQWSSKYNQHPKKYFDQPKEKKQDKTLKDAFDYFLDFHKKQVKERTYQNSKNRCIQMQQFFGEDIMLNLFEIDNGGKAKITEFLESMNAAGSEYQASRCRRLLNNIFNLAIEKGWMRENQNSAREKFTIELATHQPKGNPHLKWSEVPDLLKAINNSEGNKLTQLATKLHLLMCTRVGVLVRLQWDWFDKENDQWVIPAQTSGLKRQKGETENHVIPSTPQIKKIMGEIKKINGNQKYVFFTYGGKNPHMHEETINGFLKDIGFSGRQNAHGWRDVIATVGQEVCGAKRDIVSRQLGHLPQKEGTMGHYDNTSFLDERRKFIRKWNRLLVKTGMEI